MSPFSWYQHFISAVPVQIQWLVSLGIIVLLVYAIVTLVKRSLLWLVLLLIFVPVALPALGNLLSQLHLLQHFAGNGGFSL
jgi:hypothetical protein